MNPASDRTPEQPQSARTKAEEAFRSALAVIVGILAILLLVMAMDGRDGDFLAFYTGAYMVRTGQTDRLYDTEHNLAAERKFVPETEAVIPSNRPAFYYAVLSPLSLLSYPTAWWCWVGMQIATLCACWWWAARRFGYQAVAGAILYPAAGLGIASGQDAAFLLAGLVATYSLMGRGRGFSAGMVLGLAAMKPHLIALWPLVLLVQRRWRMTLGFLASASCVMSGFLAVAGIDGFLRWIALLGNDSIGAQNPAVSRLINLAALSASLGLRPVWAYGFSLFLGFVVLNLVRRMPQWRVFAVTTTASLLVAPRALFYDYTVALLPLWLAVFRSRWNFVRYVALLLMSPLVIPLITLKPWWSVIPSATVLIFLALLLIEATRVPLEKTSASEPVRNNLRCSRSSDKIGL
ncbi:MAG: DUF2029 domain-containing protein [Bryobacterales bacterium]|nr:DUF2029 domain-containing protein [Bryobacterales bacterium]